MSGPARGRLQGIPGGVGPRSRPRPQAQVARTSAGAVALPQPGLPLGARVADALVRLPDARWLDRLLRGRAWIALIAIGLIGLVFMQVSMLGMNAGIGQAVERSDVLARQNADMRREVSALSSEERIQREAIANGLVMPPAGDVRYLRSNGMEQDAAKAAKTMRPPSEQAQATAAAAAAGATAVGSPVAGDTAAQPGATTDPSTGAATTGATDPAATGATSGAAGSTSGAAATGATTGAAAGTSGTAAGPTGTAGTTGTTATTPPAGTGSTSGATGSTSGAAATGTGTVQPQTQQAPPANAAGATAAGAAAAPGTGQ